MQVGSAGRPLCCAAETPAVAHLGEALIPACIPPAQVDGDSLVDQDAVLAAVEDAVARHAATAAERAAQLAAAQSALEASVQVGSHVWDVPCTSTVGFTPPLTGLHLLLICSVR